jgi:hypothetical protein
MLGMLAGYAACLCWLSLMALLELLAMLPVCAGYAGWKFWLAMISILPRYLGRIWPLFPTFV